MSGTPQTNDLHPVPPLLPPMTRPTTFAGGGPFLTIIIFPDLHDLAQTRSYISITFYPNQTLLKYVSVPDNGYQVAAPAASMAMLMPNADLWILN